MKKTIIPILILLVAGAVFGQETTNEKINAYAKELGVPVEELRQLVEKHQKQRKTGFTDPRAENAIVSDIPEVHFLKDSDKAKSNVLYIIDPCKIYSISGDTIFLQEISGNRDYVSIKIDTLIRIPKDT